MISPVRLKLSRTDICMPGRASPSAGGTQHPRSAPYISMIVLSLRSVDVEPPLSLPSDCATGPATFSLGGGLGASSLSIVRRRSWPMGYSISGMHGPRWNTLHEVIGQGWRENTLQAAVVGLAGNSIPPAPSAAA